MENKNVTDKRHIKLEDLMREDYIPYMEGRPARQTVISKDDSANLTIALNTSRSLEEFLHHI